MCLWRDNGGPYGQGFRSGAHPLYRYLAKE
uniref:Uncharacterized protein n=1 Tax=Myoviridae sp. ct3mI7 TaxID=2825028 RepID=A0A8S5QJX2_9CAUD|nr:MAG TPA: hypothetical protein [Myoviridae sp. ct3mI7]